MVDVLFAASHAVIPNRFSQFNSSRSAPKRCHARPVTASAGGATSKTEEYDVVVVGSGLGGLSAAAVASAGYGLSVCVLEAHTIAGGAAHSFTRKTDRGPGITGDQSSSNPLLHVLRAAGVDLPVVRYDAWGCFFEEKHVTVPLSRSAPLFSQMMQAAGGPNSVDEIAKLVRAIKPLAAATTAIPAAVLRSGDPLGTARVLSRYMNPGMLANIPYYLQLSSPFGPLLRSHVNDEFGFNFMDLLCFLLAGVRADDIVTAEVAFMFSEWTGTTAGDEGADELLEFPVGGSGALVDGLVRAIEESKTGSVVHLGAPVQRIILRNDKAVGVELKNGKRINAKRSVMSNASVWNTSKLLPASARTLSTKAGSMKKLDSFVHLHLAVDMRGCSVPMESLEVNYIFVNSWKDGIDAPQNVVVLTIPSVADANLAPEGHIVLHAYTPATEPYDLYRGLDRGSAEYESLKTSRCKVLWDAVERIIPDARERAHIVMEGTPLTHERFLRVDDGTYGPEVSAKDGMFPMADLAGIKQLLCVGQSTFPGIGVPAVAASGFAAANSVVSVEEQFKLLDRIGL